MRSIRTTRRLLAGAAALLCAASSLGLASRAGAAALPNFSFAPTSPPGATVPRGSFHYDLRPGQTIDDSVVLTNDTSQLEQFQIWPSDGYTTPSGGSLALRPQGFPMTGVGTWIDTHLGQGVYGLPADSAVTVQFALTVPANASPGDHVGGIEALNVTPVAQPSGGPAHFVVHQGIGVAIFIRVAGPIKPGAAVSDITLQSSVPAIGFGTSSAKIGFQLENTGNTVLNGSATATVTDVFGRTVQTFRPVGVQEFVPGGRFTIKEPLWKSLPFAGPLTVHVRFVATGLAPVTGQATFWILPWLFTLLVVLALMAVAARIWLWRRRSRPAAGAGGTGDPSGGAPPETPVEQHEPAVGSQV